MIRQIPLVLVCLSITAACGNGDIAPVPDTGLGTVRPEAPNPVFDADFVQDTEDVGHVEPDTGGCGPNACTPAEVRCQGAGVQTCEATEDGCGTWGDIIDCMGAGELCVDGACQVPTECVDNDGDGYGVQCDAGADCDDANRDRNPAQVETCDTLDNNCDGVVDEGFDVGMSCTVGTGDCAATGTTVCGPGGELSCNAAPPNASAEVCDGVDNDCNGMIDDGVCTGCTGDPHEPNDTLSQGTALAVDTPLVSLMCPGDHDFVSLGIQPNKQYRLNIAFPRDHAELGVTPWVDGTAGNPASPPSFDWISYNIDTAQVSTIDLDIVNPAAVETFFRIAFVETSTLRCADDDGFAPNQKIQQAFPLLRGWYPYVYMCPSNGGQNNRVSDWYRLGTVNQGDQVVIETLEDEGLFSDAYDLDLYLWSDPDGDNVYTVEATAATFADDEYLGATAAHTGTRYLEVRDYDGAGGPYWVGWVTN